MASDLLYNTEILAWSDAQTVTLRAPSGAEPDWEHIFKEGEAVRRGQLHAVESLRVQAFLHDLKPEAWPFSDAVERWRAKFRNSRG